MDNREKYQSEVYDASHFSSSQTDTLPANWTIVTINVSEDKDTMFIARQRPGKDPLICYIPLKGRRENEGDDYLTCAKAVAEMNEIVRLNDEATRQATNVRNDRKARAAWWAERTALDRRLKELLDNIEFCWLGAFKVRSTNCWEEDVTDLRE